MSTQAPKFPVDRATFIERWNEKSRMLQDAAFAAKIQVEMAQRRLADAIKALEACGTETAATLIRLSEENTAEARRALRSAKLAKEVA